MIVNALNNNYYFTYNSTRSKIVTFKANHINQSQHNDTYPIGDYMGMVNYNKVQTYIQNKDNIRSLLDELGKKNLVLIIHGSSFPSTNDTDTGFGSPNSKGAKDFIDFISGVFTGIQLGPAGKTSKNNSGPYMSTIFSLNPLFIDLEQLTKEKWGNILSYDDFSNIVNNNNKINSATTNYAYIFNMQDKALRTAYDNFINSDSITVENLKMEFDDFKNDENNSPWLHYDALYEALSIDNGDERWTKWSSNLDKNLIVQKNTQKGKNRILELETKYAKEIDFYKFVQFVCSKQAMETKKYANLKNVKLYDDRGVTLSDRDIWAYQDLFMDGWSLGCPPDQFCVEGQKWGFPVMDPHKLFNDDGSLGECGVILKKSIVKKLKEYNGVRIDHFLGLVDPWVYRPSDGCKADNGAGRLYSSPFNSDLQKYSIISQENLDSEKINFHKNNNQDWRENDYVDATTLTDEQINKYGLYIEKIILSAAKEALTPGGEKEYNNLVEQSKSSDYEIASIAANKLSMIDNKINECLIAEDIGSVTDPARMIMKKFNLNGMKISQFLDASNENDEYLPTSFDEHTKNYWYIPSTHDMKPMSIWAEEMINKAKQGDTDVIRNIEYIANYLYKNDPDYEYYKKRIFEDPKFLVQSQYVMIFKSPSKNIQIFFPDLLGDRRIYNTPGTPARQNWKIRVQNNFIDQYNQALNNNTGLDFITVLNNAVKSRHQS